MSVGSHKNGSKFNEAFPALSLTWPLAMPQLVAESIMDSGQFKRVSPLLVEFVESFIDEVQRCSWRDLPAYIESCKSIEKDLYLSCDLALELGSDPNNCLEITRQLKRCPSKEFGWDNVEIFCLKADDQVECYRLAGRHHRKSYCKLYAALAMAIRCKFDRISLTALIVLIKSYSAIYQIVNLTEVEYKEKVDEFIDTITSTADEGSLPQLEIMLDDLIEDIQYSDLPYILDWKRAFGLIRRYQATERWNFSHAHYSLNSTGSRATWQGRGIPANGMLYSLIERDLNLSDMDEIIGYKSYYATDTWPTLVQDHSVFTFVPKNTRGVRPIQMADNPLQDRCNYFAILGKRILRLISNDCTYNQDKGLDAVKSILRHQDKVYKTYNLDSKSATDNIGLAQIKLLWTKLFGSKYAEYMLSLYSGEVLVKSTFA